MLTELQAMGNGTVRLVFVVKGEPQEFLGSAMTLTDMIDFERDVCQMEQWQNPANRLPGLRYMLWCILKHNAPELTLQGAGDLFELQDFARVEELVQGFLPPPEAVAEAAVP